MQILAALVAFSVTYGGYRLAIFVWNWLLMKSRNELTNYKHRKNGKVKEKD